MTSRPAYDEITLAHGDITVRLRPSLRAASTLEHSHDGFECLFRRIVEFHIGTVTEIIMTAATDRKDAAAFLSAMTLLPLGRFVEIVQAPIAVLCAGFIPQAASDAQPSQSAPIPFRKFYTELFRIAAGNLGWPAEQAWQATPTEILEAYRGRVDLLRSIFGGEAPAEAQQPDMGAKLDRDGLNKLRGMGKTR
jgi:hypothetical protein